MWALPISTRTLLNLVSPLSLDDMSTILMTGLSSPGTTSMILRMIEIFSKT